MSQILNEILYPKNPQSQQPTYGVLRGSRIWAVAQIRTSISYINVSETCPQDKGAFIKACPISMRAVRANRNGFGKKGA